VNYKFGPYSLDVDRQELQLGTERVAVEPQVLDLLQYLICNRERVVSKDDLIENVWHGRIVSESTLTSRITMARKAIGDSGDQQQSIRTIARKGFRFVAAVREYPSPVEMQADRGEYAAVEDLRPRSVSSPPSKQMGRSSPKRLVSVAAVCIAFIAGVGAVFWFAPWPLKDEPASVERMAFPLPDKPSIAVLPFINMSDDTSQEYFVDGITEDLITDLSKLSSLFVISRNSTFTYKGKIVTVRRVAEELGVRYVLEGSVRRVSNDIRVNVQLVDATTSGHLWADRYDGRLDNVFALQDRITKKIFAALAVKLSPVDQEKLDRKETYNIAAYDAFLKGWKYYRQWTPSDFREALPYFLKAIELDPQYGRAYAAIASIYTEAYQRAWDWSHVVGVSAEAMPGLAGEYLKKALEYPTPLAHQVASKWYVILLFSEQAITEAARCISLDPNDAVGYAAMATALIYSGKPEEAVDFVNKAIRLDPNNISNYLFTMGMAYFGLEQYQLAVSFFERAFKLNPELGLVQRAYLAAAYVHLGKKDRAIEELNRPEIKEARELYDLYVKYEGAYYKYPRDTDRLINSLRKIGSVAGG